MIEDSPAATARATIEGLRAADVATRRRAAEDLALCGEDARVAAVPLALAAADADEYVREFAVAALESLGPPLAGDHDALVAVAGDERTPDDAVYWAVTLLARLGPAAVTDRTRETLMRLCLHASAGVRRRTRWAIRRLG
ncbi:MAG: hypothetical protein AAF532_10605 [Planctomycetota bacterium]